jgi:DNA (cytosine-5)-methyltransferase 1
MSEVITHGSLFSGIGGFDLAAEWMGIENIFQVEIDEFCQKVLQKNFPETKKYKDIKEFNGKEYEGKINIISGGFPCQPFSQAGKRKGTDDDRHLFPEMLRVISEVKPDWVIAENVYGLLNIQDGMVFEQVCTELENLEYEVQAFIIPACGKNAPHKRDRLWIIANSRCKYGQRESDKRKSNREIHSEKTTALPKRPISNDGEGDIAYTNKKRELQQERFIKNKRERISNRDKITPNPETEGLEKGLGYAKGTDESRLRQSNTESSPYSERRQFGRLRDESKEERSQNGNELFGDQFGLSWLQVATDFCRMDDGVSEEFYKLETSDRVARLKALGNAIVPQVAYEIFKAIKKNYYG